MGPRGAQRKAGRRWKTRAGLDCSLKFFQMRQQLLLVGPALEVEADHLEGPQRRLAARPESQQEAGDDGAIGLNLASPPGRAQQVPAAQDVFEKAEKQFDRPPLPIYLGNDLGR